MMTMRSASGLAAALFTVLLSVPLGAAEPAGQTLANADIVALTRSGASPMAIVERIYSSSANFDLTDSAFLQLKENGVADEVLNAMLARAGSAGAPGLQPPALSGAPAPSLSLPSFDEMSLTPPALPNQQSAPSFTDMPGFDDLPAFGEIPSLNRVDAPALSALPPPASVAAPVQQPVFSPPPPAPPPRAPQPPPPAAVASSTVAPLPGVSPSPVSSLSPTAAVPTRAPVAPAPGGRIDGARFERELIAIAEGTPEGQRAGMAWMLANRDQTLPILRQTLHISRPEYQAAALRVLGTMRDQESLAAMRDSLGDVSPLVRQYAAQALAELNDARAITAAEQNIGRDINPKDGLIRLVGYARLVRASETLASVLAEDALPLNRAAAAWSLAEIGPASGAAAWPALQKALSGDADGSVRREAAAAVARFHFPESARLLQNACRRDPEVRKTVLAAMADYPDMVEFLIGVMNLGHEMIAPDEVEAAAKSLAALTGQNFGLEGRLWQTWYAGANPDRADELTGVLAAPPSPAPAPETRLAAAPSTDARQVDIARLGIVIDPSDIPMAPEVDSGPAGSGGGPVRAPGLEALAGYNPSYDFPYDPNAPLPEALSVVDFEPASAPDAPAAPSSVSSGPSSGFAGGGAAGSASGAPGAFSSQWGDGIALDRPSAMSALDGDEEALWGGPAGGSFAPQTPSAMPTQSVVGSPPAGGGMMASPFGGGAPEAAPSAGGGLRLALPPMGDDDILGGDGGMPGGMLGTVAAGAAIPPPPVERPDEGFDAGPGLGDGEAMLYAPSEAFAEAPPSGLGMMDEAEAFDMMGGNYDQTALPPEAFFDPAPAPVLPMGDSVNMDEILHDGFAGEVIVPRAGVDSGAALLVDSQPMPASSPAASPVIPDVSDVSDDDVQTLAFPGDTSDFGLGDPLFSDTDDGYPYDDAPVAMPPIGGGAAPEAPVDPLAAGLLGALDDDPEDEDFAEAGGFEGFEDFGVYDSDDDHAAQAMAEAETADMLVEDEDGTASWFTLSDEHALPAGTAAAVSASEIETYADDSETVDSMEWVRGVGLVKRSAPAPAAAPAPVRAMPEAVSPFGGFESHDEYEILEEGYLTAPEDGDDDFFGSSDLPTVGGEVLTSPSGPPLLGQEGILDVPEDAGSDPSGRPSRQLRKKR